MKDHRNLRLVLIVNSVSTPALNSNHPPLTPKTPSDSPLTAEWSPNVSVMKHLLPEDPNY